MEAVRLQSYIESQKRSCIEYETHSLIAFLLGDSGKSGWLDVYSGRNCGPRVETSCKTVFKSEAAAA